MRPRNANGIDTRGQFVLLAGVVVALALVAMLGVYLQLGYHADVDDTVDRPARDGIEYLDRATATAARDLRGQYAWSERDTAVAELRDRLDPELRTLAASQVESGIAYRATFNRSAARERARTVCPDGPAREFGDCEADRGVVVQERVDQTHVLAAGYDLNVTTPEGETSLTVVVNATS